MARHLEISDLRVSYDPAQQAFRITSKATKLRGKPFQITLPAVSEGESRTVDTLFDLMRDEGLLAAPERISSKAVANLRELFEASLEDPATTIFLGETFGGEAVPAILDSPPAERLRDDRAIIAPNTFISGGVGTGKTQLLKMILRHAEYFSDQVFGWVLTPNSQDRTWRAYTEDRRCGTRKLRGRWECYDGLRDVLDLVQDRNESLVSAGRNNWSELDEELRTLFVVLDDLDDLVSPKDELSERVLSLLLAISRQGRSAGVYLFAASKGVAPEALAANLGRRISMGNRSGHEQRLVLRTAEGVPRHLLRAPGRALVSTYGEDPRVIQTYAMF